MHADAIMIQTLWKLQTTFLLHFSVVPQDRTNTWQNCFSKKLWLDRDEVFGLVRVQHLHNLWLSVFINIYLYSWFSLLWYPPNCYPNLTLPIPLFPFEMFFQLLIDPWKTLLQSFTNYLTTLCIKKGKHMYLKFKANI